MGLGLVRRSCAEGCSVVGPRQAGPGAPEPTPRFPAHHPQLFNDAIRFAVSYKRNSRDFMDEVLQELEVRQAQGSGA